MSSGREERSGSTSDSREKKDTPAAPRGKRYERDRRGNWGRNERRKEWVGKGEPPEASAVSHREDRSETETKRPERGTSNSKDRRKSTDDRDTDDYDTGRDRKYTPRPRRDSRETREGPKREERGPRPKDGGRDRDRDRDYDRDRDSHRDRDPRDRDDRRSSGSYRGGGGGSGSRSKGQGDGPGGKMSGRQADRGSQRSSSKSDGAERDDSSSHSGGAEIMSLLQKKPASSRGKSKDGDIKAKVKSASDLESQWIKEEEDKRRREEAKKKKEEQLRQEEERRQREEEEKKRQEEEEKRLEEERLKKEEEERKRREEEEAARQREEELKAINDFVAEVKERNETKAALRDTNLQAQDNRPDESFFTKLDSSLKKNTAFVKRLKNLTELQKDSLSKDLASLNLTKYIGEVAAALTEAKMKMSDIPCAVHICSQLHQRYAEFSVALLENWNKVLPSKKEDKVVNASKLRVDLRLFAELVSVGIFTERVGLGQLANQLLYLVSNDKEEHHNLAILLSFTKHCGDDYAGLVPRRFRLLGEKYGVEIPKSQFLKAERQKACRKLLNEYFQTLSKHLLRDHKDLQNLEKQNRKILHTKGELSQERKDKLQAAQTSFQKLVTNSEAFADIMDEDLPELPVEVHKDDLDMGLNVFNPKDEFQYEGDMTLFEDEDTRAFYENLPDLRAFIPSILYSDSENVKSDAPESDVDLDAELEELNVDAIEQELELSRAALESQALAESEAKAEQGDSEKADGKSGEAVMEEIENFELEIDEDDNDLNSCLKLLLDSFITNLPSCVNRELIDKAAVEFCTNLNTKSNRKKLVRALFTVHRTRYDLLPFYSRLVAILHPCMPDVATDLGTCLKGDFRWHVRKKDQINIESKLKTVRYIGELVKFKMFPKAETLHCLKMLLFDFSHHNIEMACALLDTCGRFLYRSPESHHRTKAYLELMMRKKNAFHLDSRYSTLIENAYYYSNPPETRSESVKVRPPLHQYIRRLLYKDLSKVNTERVLRQLRKLNWDDPEVVSYTVKCLTNIYNVRYNSIHCAANLLAGLAPYHEEIAVQVVDGVLEDIRLGMEINHPKFNQRRVSSTKYLGELYNYRMVESAVIFRTLYSFITFGVSLDDSLLSPLDPPEHLFRIRLACVLLETCGQYFDRGSSKKKLDCFLVYFQRYYWFKRHLSLWSEMCPFPMEVEYLLQDTVEHLRPKLRLHDSYEEACKAAEELDEEFRAKLAALLPTEESEEMEEEEDGLGPIAEIEESDELSQSLSQARTAEYQSSQDSDVEGTTPGSRSQSQSQGLSESQGESRQRSQTAENDGDEEDILESAGEEEEEDQVTVITGGPKLVPCPEDDDFMTSFDKMMAESITTRSNEALKVPPVDIAVPMHLKGQKKEYHNPIEVEKPVLDDNTIKFTLLTKQGNKQKFATLNVPISTEFANKFQERKEAERQEKEKMKKVVLDIHERQEEEDYQEMLAGLAKLGPVQQNRERKVKYQHPKGAPDADLIFGSK